MIKASKLLHVALMATLALIALAGTATASRSLSVAPGGGITGSAPVTLVGESGRILSLATLTGTLNRSIAKVSGAAAGSITGCRFTLGVEDGAFRLRHTIRCELTLPWSITYESFRGTLPNITGFSIVIRGLSFLVENQPAGEIIRCLYEGDIFATIIVTGERTARQIVSDSNPARTGTGGLGGGGCAFASRTRISIPLTLSPTQTIGLI